jgi:hypothetical protein
MNPLPEQKNMRPSPRSGSPLDIPLLQTWEPAGYLFTTTEINLKKGNHNVAPPGAHAKASATGGAA